MLNKADKIKLRDAIDSIHAGFGQIREFSEEPRDEAAMRIIQTMEVAMLAGVKKLRRHFDVPVGWNAR